MADDQNVRDELLRKVRDLEAAERRGEHLFGVMRLRVGGHWGRTLVAQGRYEPPDEQGRRPDDRLVGMVDTPELAAEICRRWNGEVLPPPVSPRLRHITTGPDYPF